MKKSMFTGLMLGVPLLVLGLHASPTWAASKYYVNADSGNKDDAHSCTTKSAPCATLTGVLAKVSASAHPENATVYAAGTFVEAVSISDTALSGLTLTWLNSGTRSVVDATGNSYGIEVDGVDGVTINHFEVTGSNYYGIHMFGSSNSHLQGAKVTHSLVHDLDTTSTSHYGIYFNQVDDAVISHNGVYNIGSVNTDLSAFPTTYGISVIYSNQAKVLSNKVHDSTVSVTYTGVVSYTWASHTGLYFYQVDNAEIKHNTIKDLTSSSTNEYTSGSAYAYVYPIYVLTTSTANISGNVIRRSNATATATQNNVLAYATVYSIYAGTTTNTTLHHNKVIGAHATTQVLDDESGSAVVYGFDIDGVGSVTATHNTVKNIHSTVPNGSGSAYVYGLYLNNLIAPEIANNTIDSIDSSTVGSTSQSTGDALTYGMYLSDSAKANIAHNKIVDFFAYSSDSGQSFGIQLGYNASADLVNNLVYFTTTIDQAYQFIAYAVRILSVQADPVRILNNTFANMSTCLDITDGGNVDFENNICYLKTSGGFGVSLDSDVYDVSLLNSNYNIFYNTKESIMMNDSAVGSLSFSDWKSGEYDQDAQSLKTNPDVFLVNPDANNYLHLMAGSPAADAGDSVADFGSDAVMNGFLAKDWDGDARPLGVGVDIGADESIL